MLTKYHLVKAMVFPVVMYGCENWTIKKAEHWRINAFELLCWRRFLGVHWTARRTKQSILKEISADIHWKDWCYPCNILATWCQKPAQQKTLRCWKSRKAGGEEDGRGWDGWMALLTQLTWVWANSGRQWRTGKPSMPQSKGSKKRWTRLSDWANIRI